MVPLLVLPLQLRMDQEVKALKEYSTYSKASGLEHHHPMQFSTI